LTYSRAPDGSLEADRTPLTAEELNARFVAARTIAADAGRLAMHFAADLQHLEVTMKGPQDFLTAADLAVERRIVQQLKEAFPDDWLLAEESYSETRTETARALWVIDPIDGTGNFAAGRPDWCVSIGFMHLGEPTIGVIEVPCANEQYAALRGNGATRNGMPVRVSARTSIAQSTLGVDYSFRSPSAPYLAIVGALLGKKAEYRRNGSAALSLAHVAGGRLEGFVELHLYPWDVAAGLVIVQEAGGWVSDFFGQGGMKKGGPIVAAAPGIRDEFVAAVERFIGAG
jgi:myo-inositol-1(or 4)-monophosphatase